MPSSHFLLPYCLLLLCIGINDQAAPKSYSSNVRQFLQNRDSLFTPNNSVDTIYKKWHPVNDSLHHYVATEGRYLITDYDKLMNQIQKVGITQLPTDSLGQSHQWTTIQNNSISKAIIADCHSYSNLDFRENSNKKITINTNSSDWLQSPFLEKSDIHNNGYLKVYVNDPGRNAMFARKPDFPVGSIIIKEKFRDEKGKKLEMIGMMIKRESGYDSVGGDWQYVVALPPAMDIIKSGLIENCRRCHAYRYDMDFVYRSYMDIP